MLKASANRKRAKKTITKWKIMEIHSRKDQNKIQIIFTVFFCFLREFDQQLFIFNKQSKEKIVILLCTAHHTKHSHLVRFWFLWFNNLAWLNLSEILNCFFRDKKKPHKAKPEQKVSHMHINVNSAHTNTHTHLL